MLWDILAAGATAAWNIGNFVLNGCRLTHAIADLQKFGNLRDGAKPLFALFFGPVLNNRLENAGVATTQSFRLPKKIADQINKKYCKTDPQTNKWAKVAKWAVLKAAAAYVTGKKPKRVSKSDDVLDGGRRHVDERTRHDPISHWRVL